MTKSEVLTLGHWPEFFLKNLVSKVPDLSAPTREKLIWHCDAHGDYEQSIGSHLNGRSCPRCALAAKHASRRAKNPLPDWFLDDLHPEDRKLVLEQKVSLGSYLRFLCKEHGYYTQIGNHHRDGHNGCPICRKRLRADASKRAKRDSNPFPKWFLDELHPDEVDRVLNMEVSVNDEVKFVCPKHGVYSQVIYAHINMSTQAPKCGCPSCAAEASVYGSRIENKLREDLEKLGLRVTKERGKIKSPISGFPMELDIYLPDYKLAVEVNGLWYHSYEYLLRKYEKEDAVRYHLIKTEQCAKNGIQLLHLFEDDLLNKYDICINLILSKIGKLSRNVVGARKCEIRIVNTEIAREFYDKNHIQGWGQGVCYGLFYDDNLVSAMSFRRSLTNTIECGSWELNRYATIKDIFVVGGFERLLKHAQNELLFKRLISFADKTVSNGALYKKNGFVLESESQPDYKYVYHNKRYHKFNFRIQRFKEDENLQYEPGLTEEQLANLNGIERIYDCGKMKFVKNYA